MSVDGSPAHSKGLGDRFDGVVARRVHPASDFYLLLAHGARSAASPAAGSCRLESGLRSIPDQISLELGKRREDMKNETSAWGGGIDVLLEALEPDASLLEHGDGLDQMLQRSTQPVEAPDDKSVSAPKVIEDSIELRAGSNNSAHLVVKGPNAAGRGQGV